MTDNAARPARVDVDEFVTLCLPALRRRAARCARRFNVDVDDVVQETVARALTHLEMFNEPEHMLAWCTNAALNVARTMHRSPEETHHVPVADLTAIADATDEASPDTAQLVEDAYTAAAVRAALAALPVQDRTLIEAAELHGLRYEQIAAELGFTVPKVRMLLHRARGKLRTRLDPLTRLAALPAVLRRSGRAARRVRWPTQLPAPVLYTGALVVGLTAVLQYAVPLHPPAAEASTGGPTTTTLRTTEARTASLPAPASQRPRLAPGAAARLGPARPGGDGPATVVAPPCPLACLPAVPTPPPVTSGDTVTVHLPRDIEANIGAVVVRENYAPICDKWIDNPLAGCRRHGKPQWLIPDHLVPRRTP